MSVFKSSIAKIIKLPPIAKTPSIMATSLQYQATKQGGPFSLVSVPKTVPGEKEVSIRLKAVALNPVDYKQLYYGAMIESWPALFGADGAGIVEAVGQGVSKFKAGDEVFAILGGGSKGAAFQEIATVPETLVSLKPKNVSFEEAASLPSVRVSPYGAEELIGL